MAAFKQGDAATVRQPIISGTIAEVEFDRKTGEPRFLLEWKDGEDAHSRWFSEAEIATAGEGGA